MSNSPWAKPVEPRHQAVLLGPTLDERIPPNDDIRRLDALLNEVDWSAWEKKYDLRRGQPPIHPRLVAGTILFCLMRGFRSSRRMEDATGRRIDMMWFLEGRTIDHSTLCEFQQKFAEELPPLFAEIGRRAAALRPRKEAVCVGVDGTRERANSDRHGARTAASLERRLKEVADKSEALLRELATTDLLDAATEALEAGDETLADKADAAAIHAQLEALEHQRTKLQTALERARERDEAKQRNDGPSATPVRVPVTDSDAHLLPNKEGGYAPNYTAMVVVDLNSGAILDASIADGGDEAGALAPTVKAAGECLDAPVEAVVADGNFATGENLEHFDGAEGRATLYSPATPTVAPAAIRDDPTQPVEENKWNDLPVNRHAKTKTTTLAREAFLYDASADCFYCPQGRRLRCASREDRATRKGGRVARRRYKCDNCDDCPLSSRCRGPGGVRPRTVSRDEHQPYRDNLVKRMSDPASKALYARRAPMVEGVFGVIKHVMDVRRFLTRGRAKVACEWKWVCMAFNTRKILRGGPTAAPQPAGPTIGGRWRLLEAFSQTLCDHFRFFRPLSCPN